MILPGWLRSLAQCRSFLYSVVWEDHVGFSWVRDAHTYGWKRLQQLQPWFSRPLTGLHLVTQPGCAGGAAASAPGDEAECTAVVGCDHGQERVSRETVMG